MLFITVVGCTLGWRLLLQWNPARTDVPVLFWGELDVFGSLVWNGSELSELFCGYLRGGLTWRVLEDYCLWDILIRNLVQLGLKNEL